MTLDEIIISAEEVADENEKICKATPDHCAEARASVERHRQLADWLKELKRARILLKATHNLLEKQMESGYVLNLLFETVFYDEAECDGQCLMEDIENLLEYHV